MRSYYTYGAIPDPVRTVRGFDDGGLASAPEVGLAGAGGEDKPLMQQLYERGEISDAEYRAWLQEQAAQQSPGPSQEYNQVTRLPTTQPESALDYGDWKGDVQTGKSLMDFFNLQRERQFGPGALSSFTGPTSSSPVMSGNFSLYNKNERSAAEVAADYAKQSGLDLAGLAASQGKTEAELMADINKAEVDPNTERGALNQIKDLAGAGDYQAAFEAAKAAEARMPGKDFVSTLVSPSSLRYITPEMNKQDVENYYDALKNVVGEREFEKRYVSTGNEFDIDTAKEKNLSALDQGANFVNPAAGEKAKEDFLSKLPVKQLVAIGAALMGATAIPGLFGAGAGTGAGAGAGAAGTAGAAGGAGAAGAGAAGAGALGTAAGAAGAASVLPEVVVAATKLGLTVPQYLAIAGGTGALASTVGGSGAATTAPATQPTTPSEPTGGLEDLEEVVVKAKPPVSFPPVVPPPVITPPTGGLPTEPATPTDADLEEVEVKAKKPTPPVVPPPVITPPSPPLSEPPPVDEPLEEVEVKAKKPTPPVVTPPVIVTPPTPPPPEPPPVDAPLDEVDVTAKRPPKIIPPPVIVTPPLTPPPDVKDILKDYKPTKIEDPNDPLNLLKDPKVIAKLLGLLGGAGAVAGGTTGGGGLAGKYDTSGGASFGAGLQPVQYNRKQLSPDIDYYTYATRPEAKFFEYNTQLAQPTQPPLPPPSEPSGVITEAAGGYIDENMTGGLIGYAKGGDAKPERYVDGPGSGRDDKIPALLSDGEYVIDAETLALLGDGSSKEGARRMDQFRAKIRQHKGRALSRGRISPNAKSPEKYMGGGLS